MRTIVFADIRTALAAWVMKALGTDVSGVVWYPWPGTKMPKPYVMLRIVGPAKVGRDDFDGSILSGQRRFTVTVNAYGDSPNEIDQDGGVQDREGPIGLVARLQTSLEDPSVVEALYAAGIGVGEIMEAVDLSELLDTKFEARAAFDFHMFAASNVAVDAGQISGARILNTTPDVPAGVSVP